MVSTRAKWPPALSRAHLEGTTGCKHSIVENQGCTFLLLVANIEALAQAPPKPRDEREEKKKDVTRERSSW